MVLPLIRPKGYSCSVLLFWQVNLEPQAFGIQFGDASHVNQILKLQPTLVLRLAVTFV